MLRSTRRPIIRSLLHNRLRCVQNITTKHAADETVSTTPTPSSSGTHPDDSLYLSQGQLISTPSSFHVPQLPPEDSAHLSSLPPYRNRWFTEYGFSTTATTTAGISPDWHRNSGSHAGDNSDNLSRKLMQNTVIDFENAYFIPRVQKPIIRRALFDEVHSASSLGHVMTVERAKAFAEANVTPLFAPATAQSSNEPKPTLEFRFVTGGYAYHSSKNPARSILNSALPHALFAGPAADQPVTLSDGSSTTIMTRAGVSANNDEGTDHLNAIPIEAFDKLEFGDLTSMACGEDSVVGSTQLLGLADGVSGWSHRTGGHAALWSRLILHRTVSHYVDNFNRHADDAANTTKEHDENNSSKSQIAEISRTKDLLDALDDGFADTKEILTNQQEIGSSTLILAVLDQASTNSSNNTGSRAENTDTKADSHLEVLNIGDSSIWVFRNGKVVFTVEHAPKLENCPRQLGTNTTDVPSTLVSPYTIPVRAGDLVLLSSDGVSDNLWINEITEILREKYYAVQEPKGASLDDTSNAALQRAADAIVLMATDRSFDNFAVCPYQLNAAPYSTGGGKTDDISVVLAEVVERSTEE